MACSAAAAAVVELSAITWRGGAAWRSVRLSHAQAHTRAPLITAATRRVSKC